MSGINPLSVLLQATLEFGLPAELLQAQISVGDLLDALVLAPQNGQDLIEILGQRVVAQLPPDVRPGETLLLQVTAFSGNRILVRNLGLQDPQNPVPVLTAQEARASVPPSLRMPPVQQQPAQPQSAQTQPPPAKSVPPASIAPPREVFVAATVRQSQAASQTRAPLAARARAAVAGAAAGAQRAVRTAGELLKAARVPDTPFTRTAAAIAPQASARLPAVLQRLESALPQESRDPRIPTLRTLIAFTARLNPAHEETLPAQISAYVSHVVEGSEPKVQQLLQALEESGAPAADRQTPAPAQAGSPAPPQTLSPAPDSAQSASAPHVARAHVAERAAAIEHDLKSVVLSLLRDPPATKTPALMQALSETVITLTGTQINVLASNAQDPAAVTFAIPLYYHEAGKPAYLRIAGDPHSRGAALDAENFHVAFVLDTANLGTVAIDLRSTGRSLNVDVKTEHPPAAARFADTLDSLRARLEGLRYRVASATANALKSPAPAAGKRDGLDLRA